MVGGLHCIVTELSDSRADVKPGDTLQILDYPRDPRLLGRRAKLTSIGDAPRSPGAAGATRRRITPTSVEKKSTFSESASARRAGGGSAGSRADARLRSCASVTYTRSASTLALRAWRRASA